MPADSPARRGPGGRARGPGGRARGLAHAARKAFYSAFYRLPGRWRRRLVRLLKQRYTVGSVMLVRTSDGKLLLLRQPPGNGWSLPAGLMDRGERPEQAAVRELAEEAGIRLDLSGIEPAVPNAIVHPEGWVDFVFVATVEPDTPVAVDGAEVYEAAFHPVDSLPPLTVPTARLLGHYGLGPYAAYPETR
jgi:8-oxo-dGTP pyrophosphatase MutT (NUDIX family)